MHEFIKSIAGRLSFSGSATRAQAVFDQAMSKGGLRWGRKAKLVAGASLAVALRESHKSDSLRDIAVSFLRFQYAHVLHPFSLVLFYSSRPCVDFVPHFFHPSTCSMSRTSLLRARSPT